MCGDNHCFVCVCVFFKFFWIQLWTKCYEILIPQLTPSSKNGIYFFFDVLISIYSIYNRGKYMNISHYWLVIIFSGWIILCWFPHNGSFCFVLFYILVNNHFHIPDEQFGWELTTVVRTSDIIFAYFAFLFSFFKTFTIFRDNIFVNV